MGEMAARISLGLQGFAHAGADHVLQWDIRQASRLRPLLPHVPQDMAAQCAATLDRFDAEGLARQPPCFGECAVNHAAGRV